MDSALTRSMPVLPVPSSAAAAASNAALVGAKTVYCCWPLKVSTRPALLRAATSVVNSGAAATAVPAIVGRPARPLELAELPRAASVTDIADGAAGDMVSLQ